MAKPGSVALTFALAITFGIAAQTAAAGPLSFILFWRHPQPHLTHYDRPAQTAEIQNLVSVTAKQKCENWAWAAGLETILKEQNVQIPQSYWVMKADGGELCKDAMPKLESLGKLIDGPYQLDDGRKVRLEVVAVVGPPTDMDAMIDAPNHGRPLLFVWKGHSYLYRGLVYNELIAANGQRQFYVKQVELLDPFFDTAEKQSALFDRDKDDPGDINGIVDVTVTPIGGTNWLHPEQELEHPTEIYFPK
jgi:hypothetical protein